MPFTSVIYGLGSIYLIGLIKEFFVAVYEFEEMKENMLDMDGISEEE